MLGLPRLQGFSITLKRDDKIPKQKVFWDFVNNLKGPLLSGPLFSSWIILLRCIGVQLHPS
ncbi:hypothetical protein B4123_2501 [Bacillus paralicheniformis]|nr:hypothetical protein B4123_2501 [Bacillus paralicheniformis]TWJ66444.1 hypothetical protein CHCC5021_0720 [Bacillus paralicheniformis]TWL04144.1 hypothetical protein CHCC19468_1002 [Bacillus paralicheniformis]TWL10043.1 hypothetical protein CHCC19467_2315 [Bacillus paralicheniformis]TWL46396.1 hypothetical protein CHCC15337_1987 [Bacillus paralicheniformis]